MTEGPAATAPPVAAADIPAIVHRLCDDTSMFAPTRVPLAEALATHVAHSRSSHRRLIGPLVVAGDRLEELRRLTANLPSRSLWMALAVPAPSDLGEALRLATSIDAVRLAGAEVDLPPAFDPTEVVAAIAAGLDHADVTDTEIYVEVPRDDRRIAVLDALADSDFDANLNFETNGDDPRAGHPVTHPADEILDAVARHLPFKVRSGLQHAVSGARGGSEQYGFLNVFLAVDAARQGVDSEQNGLRDRVTAVLADRDGESVARRVRSLGPERAVAVRSSFTSLGTASITDPLDELIDLGLIDHEGA